MRWPAWGAVAASLLACDFLLLASTQLVAVARYRTTTRAIAAVERDAARGHKA